MTTFFKKPIILILYYELRNFYDVPMSTEPQSVYPKCRSCYKAILLIGIEIIFKYIELASIAPHQFQPERLAGEYFSMRPVTLSRHSLRSTISWPADMCDSCKFSLFRLGRWDLTKLCHLIRCLRRSLLI